MVFDTTDEEVAKEQDIYDENTRYDSFVIIVGKGHVVEGLDEDIVGKEAGYHGTVEIPPELGYGEHKTELVKTYPTSKFTEPPVKGMRAVVDGQQGMVVMTIGRRVRIDFNSPMAGKTLIFDYVVEEQIDDDLDKIKSLLQSYFRMDFDVELVDDVAMIEPPGDLRLNQNWLLVKSRIASELIGSMELDSVKFVETYQNSE
uniref:Peptidyl-prolyl cis-trans isomerase n=1 Tax=Candidatus Methanogaster sp. ANME-2c ERB4 TaxID=2759911 RepID=A0A7G9YFT0_9EURY|nr:putative FKBP-type peptidyl-prolyl cis-trans isomerase [Methanosarcinales archaeon ANME-2c ERB4]QNO46864.1 putative FKBP-type peptidyl-prolyl cis-trans isomerase [Methanosarcinales archaeon ANME-2c ERB4]